MERGRPKAPGGFTPRNTLAEPKKKQLFPNKFTDFIIAPFLPSKERTNEEPPLKRQKLDKVSTEDIDSTEDELVDTVPAARRAQNGSQKSSIQGKASMHSHRSYTYATKEYNNVEKMMRPTSQKRGKHAGRAMADEGKLPVQTVDLRSPNPEAEPETVTPKSKSPEKSRYFPLGMEAIRQNVVDGLATDIRAKPTTNGGFAPPDSSPDELGGEFKPRRRSPDRVPGSNNVVIEIESQESAPKAIPTPRMVRRAPSLSQPSHSSQPSRYKGVNSFRASREDVGGDIGLKSIAYRLKAYNDGSMGLVFNKSQGQIEFMREGQKVDEVARVDKIRRVVYCASDPTCPKYRFELASNNAQGRTVDIECFNIRDYKNLLAELRLRNLSLYPKEP